MKNGSHGPVCERIPVQAEEAKEEEQKQAAEERVEADTSIDAVDSSERRDLEEALEKALADKQRAIEDEDYDAAHVAKKLVKELEAQLENLGTGGLEQERMKLEEQLAQVRAEKQQAIEDEDYDAAHEVKKREKELLAELESLELGQKAGPSRQKRQELEEQLRQARADKQAAIEAEDYDAAYEAKELEKKVLAELEQLGSSPTNGQRSGGSTGTSAKAAADSAGSGDGSSAAGICPQVLKTIAGWEAGRPPVVVAGQKGDALEAVRQTLPEASIWELPSSALDGSATRAGTQLMRAPVFWDLLEAGVSTISSSRAFSDSDDRSTQEDFGDGLKRGTPVRLCRLNSEAWRQHNGKGGTLVAMDRKGFHVRIWDDDVIQVFRNNMTHLKFKLAPPSPVMLTNMDRWIVKLKDLKSKPELNGQEGTTSHTPSDSGRHNVQLKDGTVIAAKPANFQVLEYDRPELEGCVGLLDGYQIDKDSVKYKVILVKPGGYGRVRLQGLVKKPELNGKEGSITSFKMETQRYQVVLEGGAEIAAKRANIEFLETQRITARLLSLRPDSVDYWLDPDDEEMLFSK